MRCMRSTLCRPRIARVLQHGVAALCLFGTAHFAAAQSQSAAVLYEQLAASVAPLNEAFYAEGSASLGSDVAFERDGVVDSNMARWLEGARGMRADLIRSTSLRYSRALDRTQGFSLLLPHLSESRTLAKAIRWLALDAARHGDNVSFAALLRAQSAIAQRMSEDRVVISSLVGLAIGQFEAITLQEMIERGELNQDAAKLALAATEGIRTAAFMNLSGALTGEREMLLMEMGKLSALETGERNARLLSIGLEDSSMFPESMSLEDVTRDTNAYYDALDAIGADPHAEGAKKAIAKLEADVASGKYGEMVKLFGAAIGRMIAKSVEYDEKWVALAKNLEALADGTKKPEDFLTAAKFYIAAANACAALSMEMQVEIETLRLAGTATPHIAAPQALWLQLEKPIIDNVLAGSHCEKLIFPMFGQYSDSQHVNGFLRESMPGIVGAVRVLLAQALVTSNEESLLAALRVFLHYASTGTIGHSLVAEQIAIDTCAAFDEMRAGRPLTAITRAALGELLGKVSTEDPCNFRRAIERERLTLATTKVWLEDDAKRGVLPFDEQRLKSLPPNQVAFLVAVKMNPVAALTSAGCACPHDGALMDLRSWFKMDALEKAMAQHERFMKRIERCVHEGQFEEDAQRDLSPLAGLQATEPLDLSQHMQAQLIVLARLQALANETEPTEVGDDRRQPKAW